jgi:hypothetical protein
VFESTVPLRNLGTLLAVFGIATLAQAQTLSTDDLARRAVERRAIEAVIWGMPAVNTELMYQAMLKLGGKPNQIVYWSGLLDWKNQTLTPNPDVIYFMAFFDTKAGPVVIEVPPAGDGVINGSIMDPWQAALEDVGPAGADKGASAPFIVRVELDDGDLLNRLPAGSTGTGAIFTDAVKMTHIIRKVLLRQLAILNYVDPF